MSGRNDKALSEMIGEWLREASVLIAVFGWLDRAVHAEPFSGVWLDSHRRQRCVVRRGRLHRTLPPAKRRALMTPQPYIGDVDPYAAKLLILFIVMSVVGIIAAYYEGRDRPSRSGHAR
jgi:hypothetical protein